jgi:tetratricopeptide (TPR) repeat protein
VIANNDLWEDAEIPRLSMDDHFLERISNLEETVTNILEHFSRLTESFEVLDRNAFVTRSGLSSLIETMKETNLLREDLLYQHWESTMSVQMEGQRTRDRFGQMKGRFLALYRGSASALSSFTATIDEAEFLLLSDRTQDHATALAKAFELDPENYELSFYLAEFFYDQGETETTIEYLESVLAAKTDHAEALLMKAMIDYSEGREAEAKILFERCLEVRNNAPIAMLCLASILVSEKDYKRATSLLDKVNEIEPQAQAHYLLGLIGKEKKKLKDAIDHLSAAIEMDPDHEDAIFTLGMVYLERGWTRKAKAQFMRALELNPKKLEFQEATLEGGEETGATYALDEESQELMAQADALVAEGKTKQALPQYRQLLRRNPGHPLLLSSYAVLIYALQRYEETLTVTRKILSTEETELPVPRYLAFILRTESFRAMGRFEEAMANLEEMQQVFTSGPGYQMAQWGIVMTKADMGQDLKNAEILAHDILENCSPEFRHHALDALGWVYMKQGKYEQALEKLENALNLQENLSHLYHYGMVLLALNLQDQATKVFERAVALRNQSKGVDDFILAALQGDVPMGSGPKE